MDAVNRYWQVLRALVLVRPLVVVMLGLFYLVAIFLFQVLDPDKRASVVVVMSAIPAWGFLGVSTERIIKFAAAGATIGVPSHVESLRSGQIGILIFFVGAPVGISILNGGQPSYMFLLCIPAALGVLFTLYSGWVFVGAITIALGARFIQSTSLMVPGLDNPAVRAVLIVASVIVLGWWLGLAHRVEQRARGMSLLIADATQEASSASVGESLGVDAARFEHYEQALDRAMTAMTSDIKDSGITSRVLGAGLAIDMRPKLRPIKIATAAGWLLLLIAHGMQHRQTGPTMFIGVTFFAAINLFSRINILVQAWKARETEEALMLLTPRWPDQGQVKKLFVAMILQSQLGTWITWTLITVPFYLVGWVSEDEATLCMLVMCAMSCAACASVLVMLSLRKFKEVSIVTIILCLCCAAGVAIEQFGSIILAYPRALGSVLIVGPLILGVLRFSLAPLQFPVRKVTKQ